ncbi:MAG: sialidase family protein [Rhodospirillaceae bacterium]|nr:sialidase family protein [Rhodospirillaceae bacterium]
MQRVIIILTSIVFSWAALAAPVSPAGHIAATPDVAVNGRGDIAVLWTDQTLDQAPNDGSRDERLSYVDLHVAISRDGGATFAPSTKVNRQAGLVRALSVNRPRIVAGRGAVWHVSFTANEIHPRFDHAVLTTHTTRSLDGGASFAPARRLSTWAEVNMGEIAHIHGGYAGASAFGTIAADTKGAVHVLWIDSRTMTPESDVRGLYAAVSRDDGATFASERELLRTDVCPCCQMMAAADGATIYASLRMVTADGARPASLVRIAADGTLRGPADMGGARWQVDGCPMKPAAIAVKGDHVFAAVYNGGADQPGVYLSHSADGGKTFAAAVAVHPEAGVSDAPSLAVNDRGAMLAWHGKTDGPRRVFYRAYDPSGKPVGAVAALATGEANAQNPVVAARADGQFQVVWQQSDRVHTTVIPASPDQAAASE